MATTRTPTPREQRLSLTFWGLARHTEVLTNSTEPVDIVRHALAALDALVGKSSQADITADALSFLLQLEHTPHYASPEQSRGGEKDKHALVYSIGVLMFERLTGHHPFVESMSPMLAKAVRDRSRGANNLCTIPGDLRAILQRAMSPFAEDRYDGVDELQAALAEFVVASDAIDREEASPPLARHADLPTAPRRPRRWPRATPPPCPGSEQRRLTELRNIALRLPLQPPVTRALRARTATPPPIPPLRMSAPPPILHRPPPPLTLADETSGLNSFPEPTDEHNVADLVASLRRPRALIPVVIAAAATAALLTIIYALGSPSSSVAAAAPELALELAPEPAPPPVSVVSEVAPVTPPAIFDPDLAGAAILADARSCFSQERLHRAVELGVSLRFNHNNGKSDRIYFTADHGLPPDERRCLDQQLLGISAGAAPARNTMVTYSLWFTSAGGRHSARVRDDG